MDVRYMFEYIFIIVVKDYPLYDDFASLYTYLHFILFVLTKMAKLYESECWIDNVKIIHKIFLHSR